MIDWFDRHTAPNLWLVFVIAFALMASDCEPSYARWYNILGAIIITPLWLLLMASLTRQAWRVVARMWMPWA